MNIKKIYMKLIGIMIIIILGIFTIKPMVVSDLKKDFLTYELKELKSYIIYRDSLNEDISKVPVSWHLDHALITINEIYKVMDTSNVENYRSRFHFGRTIMFTFDKIPRGRAESPKIVRPLDVINEEDINAHLEEARMYIRFFDSLPKKAHFKHPYIGMLNRRQSKKFLKIHTEHHLRIIRDILKIIP